MKLDDYGIRFRSYFEHRDYSTIEDCVQEIVDHLSSLEKRKPFQKRLFWATLHGQEGFTFSITCYMDERTAYVRIGEGAIKKLSDDVIESLAKVMPPLEDHGSCLMGVVKI